MKKIHINYKSISLALCLTLGLSACNDSFLERAPLDAQSDASFWKTEEDATKFLIGTFRYLVQTENHTLMTDCYTDNAVPVHVFAEQGALSAGTATASNAHFLQLWNDAYSGIRRCLIYKENIDRITSLFSCYYLISVFNFQWTSRIAMETMATLRQPIRYTTVGSSPECQERQHQGLPSPSR